MSVTLSMPFWNASFFKRPSFRSHVSEMGTLTSCSFMPLNSEFRSNPVRRAFRERIQCHRLTRLRGTSCFFSRARVPKWGKLKHVNLGIRSCFGTNDNDSEKDNVGAVEESGGDDSKSNVTTTMPEEERGFSSEKSTPPSTSHRVRLNLQIILFMNPFLRLVEVSCYVVVL